MPKVPKHLNKEDPEYQKKRDKNNEAIKKTRAKAKAKSKETETKLEKLKTENKELENQINVLGQQMDFLKDVYHTHTETSINDSSEVGLVEPGDQNVQHPGNMDLLDNLFNQI